MDALLERLPAVYALLAFGVALLPAARYRALGGAGVALLGLAAAADAVADTEAGGSFTTINEFIALAGAGLALLAFVAWLRSRGTDPALPVEPPLTPFAAPLDPMLLAGLALAAFGPHLLYLGLGAAFALASAVRTTLQARRAGWLLLLALSGASLGTALGLLLTILGPGGGSLGALGQGPVSVAAERLLGLLLGLPTLLLAALPPLHRAPWGRSLAPLSALLLARVLVPALPVGLAVWQVPAMLLLAIAVGWSALTGRWARAAIAGGLLTLWSGSDALAAAAVLVVWGWLVEIGESISARRSVRLQRRWTGLIVFPAGFAALPALAGGLRAQVLLSVSAIVACVMGLLLCWRRAARPTRAPLY